MCVCVQLSPTLCGPMACKPARLLLSVEFSRQEYWSVLPFPLPGDLPDPRIEHGSPESPTLVGGFLTLLHLKSLSLLFKTKVGGSDSKESASDERDLDQGR